MDAFDDYFFDAETNETKELSQIDQSNQVNDSVGDAKEIVPKPSPVGDAQASTSRIKKGRKRKFIPIRPIIPRDSKSKALYLIKKITKGTFITKGALQFFSLRSNFKRKAGRSDSLLRKRLRKSVPSRSMLELCRQCGQFCCKQKIICP
ncbi:unnamed protein product, partial [Brenthis ino]